MYVKITAMGCVIPNAVNTNRRYVMSTAVKSDGVNQRFFEQFMEEFHDMGEKRRSDAVKYFSERKENGRERMDDVKLGSVCEAIGAFSKRGLKVPNIFKKYAYIKLLQGKTSWDKEGIGCSKKDPKLPF